LEEVEALAREIAGTDVRSERQELARRIAEAQIDLRSTRDAAHFAPHANDPARCSGQCWPERWRGLL